MSDQKKIIERRKQYLQLVKFLISKFKEIINQRI